MVEPSAHPLNRRLPVFNMHAVFGVRLKHLKTIRITQSAEKFPRLAGRSSRRANVEKIVGCREDKSRFRDSHQDVINVVNAAQPLFRKVLATIGDTLRRSEFY